MGGIEQAPWVRVRCDLARHPRLEGLTHRARWLYLVGLLEAGENRTDGELTSRRLRAVLLEAGCSSRHVAELAAAGLWLPVENGGYRIRDYLEHQRSRTEIEQNREANRVRAQRYRQRHAARTTEEPSALEGESNGVTHGERTALLTASRSRYRYKPSNEGEKHARPSCPECGATMPPGVYLEDHRRLTHGVEPATG